MARKYRDRRDIDVCGYRDQRAVHNWLCGAYAHRRAGQSGVGISAYRSGLHPYCRGHRIHDLGCDSKTCRGEEIVLVPGTWS